MEYKKISFKNKEDVTRQDWWEKCNYDCIEWRLKNLAEAQNSTSHCYTTKTAKATIWL
ncbi:MAG: hypothetical protein IJ711_01135 [Lachnospiraceae bacterium]|nr:hypothetical protein [Lachnospiraceae bacterium]